MDVPIPRVSARGLRIRAAAYWPDAAAVAAVMLVSVLPVYWYWRNYRLPPDGAWYLLQGLNLISGRGYEALDGAQTLRGPVYSALVGALMVPMRYDTSNVIWALRFLALVNPLLLYLLVKRLAGPWTAGLAAVLFAFFSYQATLPIAVNVELLLLSVYLLSLLALLLARDRRSAPLALSSGVLLGLAILTKETALLALPVGLLAALLLGWDRRGVALHYAGVVGVCAPWWAWVLWVSGDVYLLDRLPPAAAAGLVALLAVVTALGVLHVRGRAGKRAPVPVPVPGWLPWALALAWTAAMTAAMWLVCAQIGSGVARSGVRANLTAVLLRGTPAWPLLLLGLAYLAWQVARGHAGWRLYAVVWLVWTPTIVPVLWLGYSVRQVLLPQALLWGAVAALVASALRLVPRLRASRLYGPVVPLILMTFPLALLALGIAETRRMLTEDAAQFANRRNMINAAVLRMGGRVSAMVPRRHAILTTQRYAHHLAYLDRMRHPWSLLRMDCPTAPHGLLETVCVPSAATAQAPPPETLWFDMNARCEAVALSMPALRRQMRAAGSRYLLLAPSPQDGPLLSWVPAAIESGAFRRVAVTTLPARSRDRTSGAGRLVLLRDAGEHSGPLPASMSPESFRNLLDCRRRASGGGYPDSVRRSFPQGIRVAGPGADAPAIRQELARLYPAP